MREEAMTMNACDPVTVTLFACGIQAHADMRLVAILFSVILGLYIFQWTRRSAYNAS